MKFDKIASLIGGIPYTSPQKGRVFYDFIMEKRPAQCLELGMAHGVSSCYVAAALEELGQGHLTSVDLEVNKQIFHPSIEELLERTGLASRVTVVREKTGYNWFLKKKIENQTVDHRCRRMYDFCFIDGPKNWTIDGLAFFLVDKLLNPQGWVVFDDYAWTYANDARSGKTATDFINHQDLSREEYEQPHIAAVFRNLVMQHPDYANFKILDGELAFAQKITTSTKTFTFETRASLKYKLVSLWRKMKAK